MGNLGVDDLAWERACDMFETCEPTPFQLEAAWEDLELSKPDPYDELEDRAEAEEFT